MIDPRIRRYIELDEHIESREEELKGLKAEKAKLSEELQDGFIEAGMQNVSVDGKTVYLSRQIWSSVDPEKKEGAKDVLRALGLGDFVKENINSQQLSAWVRERLQAEEKLPPELQDMIKVTEKWDVKVRKS